MAALSQPMPSCRKVSQSIIFDLDNMCFTLKNWHFKQGVQTFYIHFCIIFKGENALDPFVYPKVYFTTTCVSVLSPGKDEYCCWKCSAFDLPEVSAVQGVM